MDMVKGIVWILLLVCHRHATTSGSGGTRERYILGAPSAPSPAPSYPTVRFRADNPEDKASYWVMIARLRELLTWHGGVSQGIPVLREASSVADAERYILVEMSVNTGAVTFAINVVNTYIVGYLDGSTNTRHLFQEGQEFDENIRRLLFTGASTTSPRTISTSYQRLESTAGSRRSNIALGLHALEAAVRGLLGGQGGPPQQARALIVVLHTVAEAARYWEIERAVLQDGSVPPSALAIGLENSWSSLSSEIQISDGFAFQQRVRLVGDHIVADNMLSFAVRALFLMLYICPPRPRLAPVAAVLSSSLEPHYDDIDGRGLELLLLQQQVTSTRSSSDDNQDQCTVSNPRRARIIGRDGLCVCVDVESFRYSDNNPVRWCFSPAGRAT